MAVVDPFAANPTASTSFVTFSPTTPTSRKLPAPLTMRPPTTESDETGSVMSQPISPTSPTPATQSFPTPARRRGSILVAASDALSSFARKTPMRSLHLSMGGIGASELITNLGLSSLKGLLGVTAPATGGATLAPYLSVAVTQAAVAGVSTYGIGQVTTTYLANGASWGEDKPKAAVRRILLSLDGASILSRIKDELWMKLGLEASNQP